MFPTDLSDLEHKHKNKTTDQKNSHPTAGTANVTTGRTTTSTTVTISHNNNSSSSGLHLCLLCFHWFILHRESTSRHQPITLHISLCYLIKIKILTNAKPYVYLMEGHNINLSCVCWYVTGKPSLTCTLVYFKENYSCWFWKRAYHDHKGKSNT